MNGIRTRIPIWELPAKCASLRPGRKPAPSPRPSVAWVLVSFPSFSCQRRWPTSSPCQSWQGKTHRHNSRPDPAPGPSAQRCCVNLTQALGYSVALRSQRMSLREMHSLQSFMHAGPKGLASSAAHRRSTRSSTTGGARHMSKFERNGKRSAGPENVAPERRRSEFHRSRATDRGTTGVSQDTKLKGGARSQEMRIREIQSLQGFCSASAGSLRTGAHEQKLIRAYIAAKLIAPSPE